MGEISEGLLERMLHRRILRRWGHAAQQADAAEPEALRPLLARARALRGAIDQVLHLGEARLAAPAAEPALPLGADWHWQPRVWRGPVVPAGLVSPPSGARFGHDLGLFHDCPRAEMILRQIRDPAAQSPFALQAEIFTFAGSFLSLVLDLPESLLAGLKLRHLVRLDAHITAERPVTLFARLNIRHGPNTEQILRSLQPGRAQAEFDLAYSRLNEKRLERAWLDLIVESPGPNRLQIADLRLSRRPRAEL